MKKITKLTSKHLENNKAVYSMVKSRGWKMFKDKVNFDLQDFTSVMNVDVTDPQAMLMDIKLRKNLVSYIKELIESFEGQAKQFEQNEYGVNEPEDDEMMPINHITYS
jgi:hypothetical protein